MTFMFLIVILGATHAARPGRVRGHRHRARAHAHPPHQHPGHQHLGESGPKPGPAVFVGGWALSQLWLFIVAPIVGAIAAGVVHRMVLEPPEQEPPIVGRAAQ